MADLQAPSSDAPPESVFDQARRQYPIIDRAGVVGTVTPREDAGYLEFWPPGETGDAKYPRPKTIPPDRPGVEIYSSKTKPLDVLGDVVSHHLVNTDPVVREHYNNFTGSLTDEQKQILQQQYAHAQQTQGEARPYEQWLGTSGLPAYFRGYPFRQWPEEFNQKAYTPDQRQRLDAMMEYLTAPTSSPTPNGRLHQMQVDPSLIAPSPSPRLHDQRFAE